MIRLLLLLHLLAACAWPVTRTHQDLIGLAGRKGDITHLYDLYNRSQTVTPQEFGAVVNDALSDAVAIQAAIDTVANRGGGIVYCPPGRYLTNATTINMKSRVMLRGAGAVATTFAATNAGQVTWAVVSVGSAVSNVEISGLRITGFINSGNYAAIGMTIDGDDADVSEMAFDSLYIGIRVTNGAARVKISENKVSNGAHALGMGWGILVHGASDVWVRDNHVLGDTSSLGTVGKGIVFERSGGVPVRNSRITGNHTRNLEAFGVGSSPDAGIPAAIGGSVSGNITMGGQGSLIGHGVSIDGWLRAIVYANQADSNVSSGLYGGDEVITGSIFFGNTSYGNRQAGLFAGAGLNSVIALNVFDSNGLGGMRTEPISAGATDKMVVLGNIAKQNGYLDSSANGANFLYQGNGGVLAGNIAWKGPQNGYTLYNASGNAILGNVAEDNDYNNRNSWDGFHLEGTVHNNALTGLVSRRYESATARQRFGLRFLNANDNVVTGSILDPDSSPIADGGARNRYSGNRGDVAKTSALTGVTNTSVVSLEARSGSILVQDMTNRRACLFQIRGGSNAVAEIFDAASTCSATAATASSINLYYSGGYKLENLSGGTVDISLIFTGAGT